MQKMQSSNAYTGMYVVRTYARSRIHIPLLVRIVNVRFFILLLRSLNFQLYIPTFVFRSASRSLFSLYVYMYA